MLHFYLCHNISPQWHTRRLFTTRRSASAVYAIAMCPSVCHKSKFYRNGRTNRANFWQELFLKRKFVYLQNNGTFSENLSQNPDFVKKCATARRLFDCRRCCQLFATDDRPQFVTPNVDLCVQRNGSASHGSVCSSRYFFLEWNSRDVDET